MKQLIENFNEGPYTRNSDNNQGKSTPLTIIIFFQARDVEPTASLGLGNYLS